MADAVYSFTSCIEELVFFEATKIFEQPRFPDACVLNLKKSFHFCLYPVRRFTLMRFHSYLVWALFCKVRGLSIHREFPIDQSNKYRARWEYFLPRAIRYPCDLYPDVLGLSARFFGLSAQFFSFYPRIPPIQKFFWSPHLNFLPQP